MQDGKKLSFGRMVGFKRSIAFSANPIILTGQRYCGLINKIRAICFNRANPKKISLLNSPFPTIII